MGYVIMCERDLEIDPFASLFFVNCIQIREIRKIWFLENYALYGKWLQDSFQVVK